MKSKLSDLAHLCTDHVTITAESLSCKNLGQLVAEFCSSANLANLVIDGASNAPDKIDGQTDGEAISAI